jgi:hypothetical protein
MPRKTSSWLLMVVLAACGGGGSGANAPTAPTGAEPPLPIQEVTFSASTGQQITWAWGMGLTRFGRQFLYAIAGTLWVSA